MIEPGMTIVPEASATAQAESARSARMVHETAALETARSDLRAGRALTGEALEAWLTRWANGDPVDIEVRPAA